MFKWLKISHHSHSGRLRNHEHTSYVPLAALLVMVGCVLTIYTAAHAATPYDGPESASIGLTGTMPGKPPTEAATIDTPKDGQRFTISPITVSGTCPENTIVQIFKNDIFAGSTACTDAETYSLDIDLMMNANSLVAKVYDALNQQGPDSNIVNVYYDILPAQAGPLTSLDLIGSRMIINTDSVFRGAFPGQELSVPVTIIGGTPPFAVNIQWGDSNNSVVPRDSNTSFSITHVYKRAGTYQMNIQATDAAGNVAFLTVAVIINGQPSATSESTSSTTTKVNQLLMLWPLYVAALVAVISFWLGERREKHVLNKRGLLLPS